MTELAKDPNASAIELLTHYSFDLGAHTVNQLIEYWLSTYPANWVRLAIIEALYQGRYKAISVEQLLSFWKRRGQPFHHFNHEFERIVCNNFPQNLATQPPRKPEDTLGRLHNLSFGESPPAQFFYKSPRRFDPVEASPPNSALSGSFTEPPVADVPSSGQAPQSGSVAANTTGDQQGRKQLNVAEGNPATSTEPKNITGTDTESAVGIGSGDGEIQSDRSADTQAIPGDLESMVEGDCLETSEDSVEADSLLPNPPATEHEVIFSEMLQVESPIPTFQPEETAKFDCTYLAERSKVHPAKHPIHQFIPVSDSSEFHSKLKSVAHPKNDASS